jgi:Tfp pilus assembly protein PilN
MRALDLDLRRDEGAGWLPGLVVLGLALAGSAAVGLQYLELTSEIGQAQASVRKSGTASRTRTDAPSTGAEAQKVSLEMKRASEVVLELARPWGDLFATAESARTPDIALLSIESDNDKQRVRISGEAKTLDSVLEYLRVLSLRPVLADVYLQSHELQKQDPQRPVRFVLNAEWSVRKPQEAR